MKIKRLLLSISKLVRFNTYCPQGIRLNNLSCSIFGLMLVASLFLRVCPVRAAWQVVTVDNPPLPPTNTGWYTSIDVDSKNHPHISYLDYTNYDLKYGYFDGDKWNFQIVDAEGSVGWHSSLELDSHDQPHIAYLDSINSTLKYASFDGKSWTTETIDSGGAVGGISLALDSNDRPHISYQGSGNAYLEYIYYDGRSWVKKTVDSSVSIGDFTSLDLDWLSNYPAIVYFDRDSYSLKYAQFDGNSWNIGTDQSGEAAWYPSLALDSNNHPHISYYDVTGQNLKYIHFDGSAWYREAVDTVGNVGWFTSIAVDNNNSPHISYLDHTNFFLKYATKSGGAWAVTTVDDTSFVGWYSSIAIDPTGRLHISYHGASDTELKYALLLGNATITISSNKDSYSPGDTLSLSLSIDNPTSGIAQAVDIFLGIIITDGSIYFFNSSLANLIPSQLNNPKTFTAAKTSLALNPGDSLSRTPFFSVTLPPGLPEGTYHAFAALAEPGSVQAGSPKIIGDISIISFSYTP